MAAIYSFFGDGDGARLCVCVFLCSYVCVYKTKEPKSLAIDKDTSVNRALLHSKRIQSIRNSNKPNYLHIYYIQLNCIV